MSEVPKGWVQARISDILTIRNGYAFKSSYFSDSGVPLIRQSELKGDVVDLSESVCLPESFLEEHSGYVVNKGDVLIGMSGSLGKVSLYLSDAPALQNQRTGLLIVDEQASDKPFALYALKYVEPQILEQGKGVAVQNVSASQIESCSFLLPPLAELKAAQKKLGQYRQSLLKAAVEGALSAEWRAKNTPSETGAQLLERILIERRARWEAKQLAKFAEQGKSPPKDWQKKYPEPVQPDTTDLPELPEGWVWASVDQLSPDDLANGRSVPSADVGAKVLRLTAVKSGRIDLKEYKIGAWSDEEAKQFAVIESDLLIVRGNGSLSLVGRAGLVGLVTDQVAYPDTIIRLRVIDTVVSSSWVALLWNTQIVRNHLERRARTSAGIYKISQPDIVSVPIPVPPLNEQKNILQLFEEAQEQTETVKVALDSGLKQSTAQRQNILRAAFAGQLVPQDPTDEPASVLLERIRAERALQAASKKPRGRKTKESP